MLKKSFNKIFNKVMKMIEFMGSEDHLLEVPSTQDHQDIPLKCWQDVKLSNIWIPSHFLPSRSKPDRFGETRGVFHRLEKKDCTKYNESFSVYHDQTVDAEVEEIFQSDSDEDLKFESSDQKEKKKNSKVLSNTESIPSILNESKLDGDEINIEVNSSCKNDLNYQKDEFLDSNKNTEAKRDEIYEGETSCSKFLNSNQVNSKKNFTNMNIKLNQDINKTDSHISLIDILDTSPQINVKEFSYDVENKCTAGFPVVHEKNEVKVINNKKERRNKKKTSKFLSLNQFLEDCSDIQSTSEESCFHEFYESIMLQDKISSDLQMQNNVEFPDLVPKDPLSVKSNKPEVEKERQEEQCKVSLKSIVEILDLDALPKRDENADFIDHYKFNKGSESTVEKFIIEYIPLDTSEDDVRSLLFGYGEIKSFSLQTFGSFLKASVEMDLFCDIDWIIECLNGSEPFGAASETLKCYKEC